MRWRFLVIAAVVALVVALTSWMVTRSPGTTASPTPPPSPTASAPETSAAASPSPTPSPSPSSAPASVPTAATSVDPALVGCQPLDAEGFVPSTYEMSNPPAQEPILSLGQDESGNIAAPPKDEPRTASWWNQGPRPGSDAGKVVMSIHTYRNGGALGNEMYAGGENQLRPGDLIKLKDDTGRTACYEFVEAKKIWVRDYDPNSNVMVDHDGEPMLAIVICWDFDRATEIWESRIFFYAKPVSA